MQLRPGKADWGMLRALVWSTHIPVSLSFAMSVVATHSVVMDLRWGPLYRKSGKDHHYSVRKCLGCVHMPHHGG